MSCTKMIGFLAVLSCCSLAFCCEHKRGSMNVQFEQLRQRRFENTVAFKKEAEYRKLELEKAKISELETRQNGYKDKVEKLRLEIDTITVMLLVTEKIEQYKKGSFSSIEKQKIRKELESLASYYPVVRKAVNETIASE